MAMAKAEEAIYKAFASDVKLRERIFDAINETPQHRTLFEEIARYQLASQSAPPAHGGLSESTEQPTKKRKLEDGIIAVNGSQKDQPRTVILEARDISFTLPQRKKLHLSVVQHGDNFEASSTTFALCLRNPSTNQIEFEYPTATFAYALRVSVPEKAQKQYNLCLLPSQSQTPSGTANLNDGIIWTVNHGPLNSCQILSEELKAKIGKDDILENTLDLVLRRTGNKLVYPSEAEFVSALVESHRKNDKSYHVKAFRGSKDGFLFFLENGIFFGFKKPLAFFPFEHIDSLSYTAVLQRTFNLVITARLANDAEGQEIEFSMIDQADFAGIDAYVRKHQLQDSSMAEARRAKQFNVNGKKGEAIDDGQHDGQTELEKAEQELVDEEDDMEEDYDPGSDGESEGSGSSEEDDDDVYPPKSSKSGRDLVKEELGSEAEDVEITDEEEDDDEEVEEQMSEPPAPAQPASRKTKTVQQMPVHKKTTFASVGPPKSGMPDIDDEDQL